jgi:hypothetical protein
VPEAWSIRERVFRRWVRRKGAVWVEDSPLGEEVLAMICGGRMRYGLLGL